MEEARQLEQLYVYFLGRVFCEGAGTKDRSAPWRLRFADEETGLVFLYDTRTMELSVSSDKLERPLSLDLYRGVVRVENWELNSWYEDLLSLAEVWCEAHDEVKLGLLSPAISKT